MTTGTIETKGTRLYFAVDGSDILKVACATGIQGLGGPGAQINQTCLDSQEMEYFKGMKDPAQVSVPVNFIPRSAAHQALQVLDDSGEAISWMLVLSDQPDGPVTLDSDGRLASPGPTSVEFLAYVADFEIDIQTNEIVRGTLTLQRSGPKTWDFPAADLA
jgi:hypothetical protein